MTVTIKAPSYQKLRSILEDSVLRPGVAATESDLARAAQDLNREIPGARFDGAKVRELVAQWPQITASYEAAVASQGARQEVVQRALGAMFEGRPAVSGSGARQASALHTRLAAATGGARTPTSGFMAALGKALRPAALAAAAGLLLGTAFSPPAHADTSAKVGAASTSEVASKSVASKSVARAAVKPTAERPLLVGEQALEAFAGQQAGKNPAEAAKAFEGLSRMVKDGRVQLTDADPQARIEFAPNRYQELEKYVPDHLERAGLQQPLSGADLARFSAYLAEQGPQPGSEYIPYRPARVLGAALQMVKNGQLQVEGSAHARATDATASAGLVDAGAKLEPRLVVDADVLRALVRGDPDRLESVLKLAQAGKVQLDVNSAAQVYDVDHDRHVTARDLVRDRLQGAAFQGPLDAKALGKLAREVGEDYRGQVMATTLQMILKGEVSYEASPSISANPRYRNTNPFGGGIPNPEFGADFFDALKGLGARDLPTLADLPRT